MAKTAPLMGGPASPPDCLLCPTRKRAEWSVLTDEEMTELSTAKSTRSYQKSEYVYNQGQPCTGLYCIASGTAALRRAESQLPTVLVRLAFAGQTLGYRNCLGDASCTTSAKVLEPGMICHIEMPVLQRALRRSRALQGRFQEHLATDLDAAEAAMAHVAWLPVRSRVARLILELVEHNGSSRVGDTLVVALPMTRRDMAELLCTRPETLTRTMAAMEADGLLHNSGHRVAIANESGLRQEAQAHIR